MEPLWVYGARSHPAPGVPPLAPPFGKFSGNKCACSIPARTKVAPLLQSGGRLDVGQDCLENKDTSGKQARSKRRESEARSLPLPGHPRRNHVAAGCPRRSGRRAAPSRRQPRPACRFGGGTGSGARKMRPALLHPRPVRAPRRPASTGRGIVALHPKAFPPPRNRPPRMHPCNIVAAAPECADWLARPAPRPATPPARTARSGRQGRAPATARLSARSSPAFNV